MTLPAKEVYATQPAILKNQIEKLLRHANPEQTEGELVALIVPDSNHLALGPVSAQAYRLLEGLDVKTVLLVGPSHSGEFGRLTICSANHYHSPLGDVSVNDRLRNELCDADDDIFIDDTGHYHTEGAYVQLPFLQHLLGDDFDIVPIVMGEESPALCRELGMAVGEIMYGHRAIIVGCADLLEIEGDALERFQEALENFNTSELMHLLGSEQLRVEGMGAVITTVLAAQQRGANRARILRVVEPDGRAIGALACAFWRD
jgi:MEMO1 family protein